ncbi:hypothetical protein COY62_01305 [bacterium (Candidatus Howlettbacteria) CG_4_10_14_0_8_um_filter_40_9]|nr:MAG: hypothetical protein COY62_01305 [bacterium (Candidatus Howlettbacteria) CG_4_10_14_0_8_um_filter_40_9]
MFNKTKKIAQGLYFKTSVIGVLFCLLLTPLNILQAQTNQELREQIYDLSSIKSVLTDEVATFDAQITALQRQLAQTEAELASLIAKIEETNQQIRKAEDELTKQKGILDENLRILYEEGQTSSIEVVAGSDNFSEFMNKTEYLKSIQDEVSESIDKIKQLKVELDTKKKELEIKKTEQVTLKNQQVTQKAGLDQQRSAKNASLSQVTTDEKKLREELAKRMSAGYAYCKGGGAVIHAKNPIFKFPLDCGYISQGWGKTDFSPFYRAGYHNGVDVAQVAPGTAIMAIGPGTVYSSGSSPSDGWGNWIVVKHDSGYYSLYAHMIAPTHLSPGDKVNTSDVVGGIGGSPNWPIHLHFTLYTSNPGTGIPPWGGTIDPLDYMDIPISTGGTDWDPDYAH